MKTGRTLIEMAHELERQQNGKRDFVADTRELSLSITDHADPSTNHETLTVNGHGSFEVTDNTHRQIAQRLGIPQKYYDRIRYEHPDLLQENVNYLFEHNSQRRMIRTLDGNARAFLSDRYRPLDNFDLAEAVLPIMQEADGIQIVSTELTDSRMYIKALFPKIEAEVKVGDPVQAGIVVSNSEIGQGSVRIEPLVYRLICSNGMVSADHSMRRHHVGRAADAGESAFELYRDETLQQDDKAFFMRVQDIVRSTVTDESFQRIVEHMRRSTEDLITGDPVAAVEVVQKTLNLNDGERSGVLQHLIRDGDLSRYGLVNALTRFSQDVDDYDRATDFERLGGQVLELPRTKWQEIAQAA